MESDTIQDKRIDSGKWLEEKLEFEKMSSIDGIRNFFIIMNIFESKFALDRKNKYKEYKVEDWYEKIATSLKNEDINRLYNICVDRWGEDGSYQLEDLFLNDSKKDTVKNKLRNLNNEKTSKTLVILHIIRSLRNNIIHGSKSYCEIPYYEELFKEINTFLIKCIDNVNIRELT